MIVIDVMQNGNTPLHLACISGHRSVVEILLAGGADVNTKDKVSTLIIRRFWSITSFCVLCTELTIDRN